MGNVRQKLMKLRKRRTFLALLWVGLVLIGGLSLTTSSGSPLPPRWQNPPPSPDVLPPADQPGRDFWIFWQTGRAENPYSVAGANYPPPMMIIQRPIGLLPGSVAFIVWTLFNLILLVAMFKRKALLYIFFMPTMFDIVPGQNDLLFLWFSTFLKKQDWKAILAGVLITLKPQMALLLLPWHLLRWEWKTRFAWAAGVVGLWGYYFLVRPEWYFQWVGVAQSWVNKENSATPSLFSLVPFWLAVVLALGIFLFAWFRLDEKTNLAAAVFAMPYGKTYDQILLLRSDSLVWWMIPLSWAGLFISLRLNHPWPQAVVTGIIFAVALWRYYQKEGRMIRKGVE